MAIFCPNCGAQNNDWTQACGQCGTALTGAGFNQQQAQYQPPPYQQPYQQAGYMAQGYGGSMGTHAAIGKRFLSQLIDGLISFVGTLPGFVVVMIGGIAGGNDGGGIAVLMILFGYLLIFAGAIGVLAYQAYLLGRDGATIGKKIMKIRVLDANGQPLGFGKAFLREFVKGLLGQVCGLLFLYPLVDKDKQALYDKIFNSNVWE